MRRGIVLVPEGRHVVTRLSVADNILPGASCQGWRRPPATAVAFAYQCRAFHRTLGRVRGQRGADRLVPVNDAAAMVKSRF
jgi:ABC-type branched-subunit amino acid transport system ATPase component